MSGHPLLSIEHVGYTYPAARATNERSRPVAVGVGYFRSEHLSEARRARVVGARNEEIMRREGKFSDQYPPAEEPWALLDINLRVEQGEYVALLGQNGSGKSTLARHCNALLLPDEGNVVVDGMDTRDVEHLRAIRERVGMIFQNPDNQLIATVVEDDVAWGLTMRGFPLDLIHERVEEAMEAVGIAHLRQFPPHQLSGGQRQRLAIAGILALRPRCIIADEATSMLDPLSRQELVQLLARLHRDFGLTIIHVTHLLEEVVFAQRLVIMERGMIVQEGTPATVFSDVLQLRALGLVVPDPLVLAARLREHGIPIASNAVSMDAIVSEILSSRPSA